MFAISSGASVKLADLLQRLWPPVLGFLLLIVVAAWVISRIRSRYRDRADSAEVERQMLLQMGELRRGGDLSEMEYRSIKGRLTQRLDDSARRPGQQPLTGLDAASDSR